jgi:hypothetical protein
VIGHLGTRVSALLDGQLAREDEDRAWEHVHSCHQCRDQVEREGWVKTQLAELTWGRDSAPAWLKGSLLASPDVRSPADAYLVAAARPRPRGLVVLGGSALGATVIGLLALGAAPASAPSVERRAPVTSLVRPSETPREAGTSGGGVNRGSNPARMVRFGASGVTIP